MTGLAIPTPYQASPGNFLTSALWNSNVYNGLTFLLNPPITQLYASASQSIASSSGTTAALDTVVIDPYGGFNSSSHLWTAPFGGWWELHGHVNWAANATGNRACWFTINGSSTALTTETWGSVGSSILTQTTDAIVNVPAGQTIAFTIWQSSGAALATTTASGTYAAASIRFVHT